VHELFLTHVLGARESEPSGEFSPKHPSAPREDAT